MIRITHLGKPIPCFHDVSGGHITAGDAIKSTGGDPGAGAISVNGRKADGSTILKPGDSVRQSPEAFHG